MRLESYSKSNFYVDIRFRDYVDNMVDKINDIVGIRYFYNLIEVFFLLNYIQFFL